MDRGRADAASAKLKWEQSAESEALKAPNHPQHGSANEVSGARRQHAGAPNSEPGQLALPQGSTATVRGAVFI